MSKKEMTPRLLAFKGYVSENAVILNGRLIQENNVKAATKQDSMWTNIANIGRRFWVKGIEGEKGFFKVLGRKIEFITDSKGFFEINYHFKDAVFLENQWYDYYLDFPGLDLKYYQKDGVLNPFLNADYCVVSDIDDTVLQSDVKNKFKLILKAVVNNAFSKKMVRGTSRFYNKLSRGKNRRNNPIFYVSRSPAEMYDILEDFFEINNFPKGPVLLRNLNNDAKYKKLPKVKGQKYQIIKQIFEDIAFLPFILIGDNTEMDAMIYLQIAEEYPESVKYIFIRLVDEKDDASLLKKHIEGYTHTSKLTFFRSYDELNKLLTAEGVI